MFVYTKSSPVAFLCLERSSRIAFNVDIMKCKDFVKRLKRLWDDETVESSTNLDNLLLNWMQNFFQLQFAMRLSMIDGMVFVNRFHLYFIDDTRQCKQLEFILMHCHIELSNAFIFHKINWFYVKHMEHLDLIRI